MLGSIEQFVVQASTAARDALSALGDLSPFREVAPATVALVERGPVSPPRGAPTAPSTAPQTSGDAGQTSASGTQVAANLPGLAQGGSAPGGSSGGSLVDLFPAALFQQPGSPSGARTSDTVTSTSGLPVAPAVGSRPGGPAAPVSAMLGRGSAQQSSAGRNSMSQPDGNLARGESSISDSLTPQEWDELVDVIVLRLEDRVIDELNRRGRHADGRVF